MRHFLIVSHRNNFVGSITVTTVKVTGSEGLRALSAEEAVQKQLMPAQVNVHWHDLGGSSRRLTYVNGSDRKVLVDSPDATRHADCDATKVEHCYCGPDNDYQYTWYEAPDDAKTEITYREVWHELGNHKQTHEYTVTIGADGTPERPDERLHNGIADANSPMHPEPMTDYSWSHFLDQVYHTRWYEPIDDEERQLHKELREEHTAQK